MILELLAIAGGAAQIGGKLLGIADQNERITEEERRLRQIAYLQRQAAGDVRRRAAEQAGRVRTEASQQASAISAAFAASGIDPTAGTTAVNAADARVWGEADSLRVMLNAARQARGYDIQAGYAEGQAKKLEDTRLKANIGAGLGIASDVASQVYGLGNSGLFGGPLPSAGAAQASAAPAAAAQGLTAAEQPSPFAGTVYATYGGKAPPSTERGRKLWSDLWE
jgi:hypothetical protein